MNKTRIHFFCISNDLNLAKHNHHGFYFAQNSGRAGTQQECGGMTCLCSMKGGCLLEDPDGRRCLEVKLGPGKVRERWECNHWRLYFCHLG